MGFWIFMLIMDLLIPFTMIGFGKMFLKKAPDQINYVFGYRTSMSMKNQDTWVFAHHYCGKIWYICGLILLVVSFISIFIKIFPECNLRRYDRTHQWNHLKYTQNSTDISYDIIRLSHNQK